MRRSLVACCVVMSITLPCAIAEAGLYDWHFTTVESSGDLGFFISVAVDVKRDVFFVAYYDNTNTRLMLAHQVGGGGNCGGGAWQCDQVDNSADVGQYNSIDVRSGECGSEIAISYYDATNRALKVAYGYCDNNGCDPFSPQIIDSGSAGTASYKGLHTAAKIDVNGAVHVAYQRLADFDVESQLYAKKLETATGNCGPGNYWRCDTIFSYEGAGQYAALDLSATSNPTIASYYPGGGGTGYPTMMTYVGTGGNCGPGNSWRCRTAHIAGLDMGKYLSMYVEENGAPHLAFYNATDETLVYAYYDPADTGNDNNCGMFDTDYLWQCDEIQSIGHTIYGRIGIAIASDGPGDPIIAYQLLDDVAPALLMAARPYSTTDGSVGPNCGPPAPPFDYTWACEKVAGNPNLNLASEVAITTGMDGNPIIAYREEDDYHMTTSTKLVYHPRNAIFLDAFECGSTIDWNIAVP